MIHTKSLRIDYEDVTAVEDLNLHITQGQIYGLVGPNGAGKTSTIKALAGIIEPTYGEIKIADLNLELFKEKALQQIGYMPDFPPVYENLKVWEYCEVFAAAYLIARKDRQERCRYWITQINLQEKWDSYIRDLSRGMRQRLILAKTLLPNPKVLLLDEPASGLDPIARRDFRELLKRVSKNGLTILISSHILSELSDFCTAVGIMEKGRLVASGTIEEIRNQIGQKAQLTIRLAKITKEKYDLFLRALFNCPFLDNPQEITPTEFQGGFSGNREEASQLLTYFVSQNIPVCDFHVKESNIEDIFFQIGAKTVS